MSLPLSNFVTLHVSVCVRVFGCDCADLEVSSTLLASMTLDRNAVGRCSCVIRWSLSGCLPSDWLAALPLSMTPKGKIAFGRTEQLWRVRARVRVGLEVEVEGCKLRFRVGIAAASIEARTCPMRVAPCWTSAQLTAKSFSPRIVSHPAQKITRKHTHNANTYTRISARPSFSG